MAQKQDPLPRLDGGRYQPGGFDGRMRLSRASGRFDRKQRLRADDSGEALGWVYSDAAGA